MIHLHTRPMPLILILCVALAPGLVLLSSNLSFVNSFHEYKIIISWLEVFVIALSLSRRKPISKPLNSLHYLTIPILISTLGSAYVYSSIVSIMESCLHILFVVAIINAILKVGERNILPYSLIVTYIFFITTLTLEQIIYLKNIDYNWILGTLFYDNIRHFGYTQAIVTPLIFLLILSKSKLLHCTGILCLSLSWFIILWSGGRGTFFSLMLLTVIVLPIFVSKHKKRICISNFIAIAIGSYLAFLLSANHPSLGIERLFFLADSTNKFDSVNSYSSGRLQLWIDIIKNFDPVQLVFGYGSDMFRFSNDLTGVAKSVTHPHNIILQITYSFGITGILACIYISLSLKKYFQKKLTDTSKIYLTSLSSLIISSLIDGGLYHSYSLFQFAIVVALFFSTIIPADADADADADKIVSKYNKTEVTTFAFCIIVLSLHTYTYSLLIAPLTDEKHIHSVMIFPSYTNTDFWISTATTPELKKQAYFHSIKYSPNPCIYVNALTNDKNKYQLSNIESALIHSKHCNGKVKS